MLSLFGCMHAQQAKHQVLRVYVIDVQTSIDIHCSRGTVVPALLLYFPQAQKHPSNYYTNAAHCCLHASAQ
jgi:hypothetical protein